MVLNLVLNSPVVTTRTDAFGNPLIFPILPPSTEIKLPTHPSISVSRGVINGRSSRKKPRERGRRSGGHNKGYWFWKGRGWYATDPNGKTPRVPLFRSRASISNPPGRGRGQGAYARWLAWNRRPSGRPRRQGASMRVVQDYLPLQDERSDFNVHQAGRVLFDFCTGLPARFWDYEKRRKAAKVPKEKMSHGYGRKPVGELIPLDVQQWLDVHQGGHKGTRRIAVQALKRPLNYAKDMGIITRNPIRGYKVGRGGRRVTYFTPETEAKLIRTCQPFSGLGNPSLHSHRGTIRRGVLQVDFQACGRNCQRNDLAFWPQGKPRTIRSRIVYVAPEIADIVRGLLKKYPPDNHCSGIPSASPGQWLRYVGPFFGYEGN